MNICGNDHIEGLAQDCSISIANTLEIQPSCTKPSTLLHLEKTSVLRCLVSPYIHLFVKKLLTTIEYETPHYWPFVGENHRLSLDYPHTLSIMQKACACRDVEHDILRIFLCYRVLNYTAWPTLRAKTGGGVR